MPELLSITQGADRTIVIAGIADAAGAPLDVTGWSVHAQVRHSTAPAAPLLAEWVSSTPTDTQGQATASATEVRLDVPAAMSSAWAWRTGVLHVELTEPGDGGRRERIAARDVVVDPEVVRTS